MNSNVSTAIEVARSRVNANAMDRMLDDKRREFIRKLYGTHVHARLREWEFNFVMDLYLNERPFDDNQRDCIDALRKKYEGRL